MLGSWVIATNNGVCPLPGKIAEMLPRAGKVVNIDYDVVVLDFMDFGFMLDAIEPVELCAWIPLKNGFEVMSNENPPAFVYKKEGVPIIEVYFNSPGHGCRCIFSYGDTRLRITCHYVHQFQQAIRLCGIDKEVEL